jgi:hypothetical protein
MQGDTLVALLGRDSGNLILKGASRRGAISVSGGFCIFVHVHTHKHLHEVVKVAKIKDQCHRGDVCLISLYVLSSKCFIPFSPQATILLAQ